MKSDYLCLLSDRDYILKVAGIHIDQSNKGRNEIMELNRDLKYTHEPLNNASISLQEAGNQIRITNHFWEHESKEKQELFQEVIDELDSIQ